jgi:hypothetical protein
MLLLFIFLINTFDKSVDHFHDAIFYHVRPMYLFSGRHGRDRMVVGDICVLEVIYICVRGHIYVLEVIYICVRGK